MKVSQKAFGRWLSSVVAKSTGRSALQHQAAELRVLGREQLRQISGGTGGNSTHGPKGTW
jgi:hypothetical protein